MAHFIDIVRTIAIGAAALFGIGLLVGYGGTALDMVALQ
jgi:hypothetical protein